MTSHPVEPIHGDLYSTERLEQFAVELARTHRVLPGPHRGPPILARLRANRRALNAVAVTLAADARAGHAMSAAAEWLVDNFPLVEEQLREIEIDLPAGFYLELPKLADGDQARSPRVFAILWAYVEHTDSRFEIDALQRFIQAYQTVQPLTLGELWAIAISLRIVLVENLRRLGDAIVLRRRQRAEADALADALLASGRTPRVAWWMWRLARAPLSPSFAARLIQRLRDRDPDTTPGLLWLHERLAQDGTNAEDVIARENAQQVGTQGPVRDGITSMRKLSAVDWGDFVEAVSLVEAALREEGATSPPDFATRDSYRHAVEDLARHSDVAELGVAALAVARARRHGDGRTRESDVGYWLIAAGRRAMEVELRYRVPWRRRLGRAASRAPTAAYLGALAVGSAVALAIPVLVARAWGASALELVVLGLLALIPATEVAIALVHRATARLIAPRRLAKLALEDGVPAALRTLVVLPVLLTDPAEVEALVGRLEVHFLANDDGALGFALVSDWCDAAERSVEADAGLLRIARDGIAVLNARHATSAHPIFFVLHRGRRWNERQGRWMGWERKRGKLHELNRLLRGAADTTFLAHGEDLAVLAGWGVRYVITLDSDTRLPRGAARRLVGAIAHPLHQPAHDPVNGRVLQGYGILQPRITPTLPEAGLGTLTQRMFAGTGGLDPYAFAVSDVYQDLFGEGSYTGKGIYDVDAFELATAGRVPENALLSHDLFEGLHARAGLVTDIELFESHPATWGATAARQHRWARGDWQLLRWVFGPGPITAIGRWKIADNLRRTLVAPASLAMLAVAWGFSRHPGLWTAFLVVTVAVPALLPIALGAVPRRPGLSRSLFVRATVDDLQMALGRVFVGLAFLVAQAALMLDAVGRTLYRLATGRGPMLQWVTVAEAALGRPDRRASLPTWGASVGLGLVVLAVLSRYAGAAALWAAPFVVAWGFAPAIAQTISRPPRVRPRARLDDVRARRLRLTARRTWRYFETFVTPADHDLPPDNFQEVPTAVVAHRTSPTNIGLYVLSAVAAHDQGWLGTLALLRRVEATFATLDRLERHRGHFYNWYDTTSLMPLSPRYVSTVDSGNLAGHLIAVQQALLALAARPQTTRLGLAGVADALALVREATAPTAGDVRDGAVLSRHLDETIVEVEALVAVRPFEQAVWVALAAKADVLLDTARALSEERGGDA